MVGVAQVDDGVEPLDFGIGDEVLVGEMPHVDGREKIPQGFENVLKVHRGQAGFPGLEVHMGPPVPHPVYHQPDEELGKIPRLAEKLIVGLAGPEGRRVHRAAVDLP